MFDRVVVYVADEKVFDRGMVTNPSSDIAAATKLSFPCHESVVSIQLPEKKIKQNFLIPLEKGRFVLIEFLNGKLVMQQLKEAPLFD